MYRQQQLVKEFHKKFDCLINETPTIPSRGVMNLREDLIREEFDELIVAFDKPSIVDIADALGDLLYVVYGAAISCGIDLEPIFEEIHRSNMSKVWDDGIVHRNEKGKVIKPPNYSPADLESIILKQTGC